VGTKTREISQCIHYSVKFEHIHSCWKVDLLLLYSPFTGKSIIHTWAEYHWWWYLVVGVLSLSLYIYIIKGKFV